jgi:hypothetical protein
MAPPPIVSIDILSCRSSALCDGDWTTSRSHTPIQSRATQPALETRRLLFDGCSCSLTICLILARPARITNNGSVRKMSMVKSRILLFCLRRVLTYNPFLFSVRLILLELISLLFLLSLRYTIYPSCYFYRLDIPVSVSRVCDSLSVLYSLITS